MLYFPRHFLKNFIQSKRRVWLGLASVVFLSMQMGCCTRPVAEQVRSARACQDISNAIVAYYYNYKKNHPENSDIRYIENVPPGTRCIVPSTNAAPPFPDHSVDPQVNNGQMKIHKNPPANPEIKGTVDIAVYYDASALVIGGVYPSPPPTPLAVEDLSGVSRVIETYNVGSGGACGVCPQVPCDNTQCCKRPPCP